MKLFDLYCEHCGAIKRDVVATQYQEVFLIHCEKCHNFRGFRVVCNGGTGHRFRHNDFPEDPSFYRGQAKITGLEAVDSEGNTVESKYGGAMTDKARFSEDARNERRDRIYHRTDVKRGTNKLYFDAKRV